jgi:CMP-N,N'-diacetyllegionaminic acid synthase
MQDREKNRILWLITARCGSKSIPEKNIRLLNGMPLMCYRIRTALSLSPAADVWLSTDSREYAKIAADSGATIPFLRPEHLSTDTASSMEVVLHAMDHAEKAGNSYSYIGLLEPTSPFVFKNDLLNGWTQLHQDPDATAIVAVKEARPNTIFIQDDARFLDALALNLDKVKAPGRQQFKRQITPSGGFYISRWDAFKKLGTFYSGTTLSYLLPEICGLEIDEAIDWSFAEFLLEKGLIDLKNIF